MRQNKTNMIKVPASLIECVRTHANSLHFIRGGNWVETSTEVELSVFQVRSSLLLGCSETAPFWLVALLVAVVLTE